MRPWRPCVRLQISRCRASKADTVDCIAAPQIRRHRLRLQACERNVPTRSKRTHLDLKPQARDGAASGGVCLSPTYVRARDWQPYTFPDHGTHPASPWISRCVCNRRPAGVVARPPWPHTADFRASASTLTASSFATAARLLCRLDMAAMWHCAGVRRATRVQGSERHTQVVTVDKLTLMWGSQARKDDILYLS